MNEKFYITAEMIGSDCTFEQAQEIAENLTAAGYESKAFDTTGVTPRGYAIANFIPQAIWLAAIAEVFEHADAAEAAEIEKLNQAKLDAFNHAADTLYLANTKKTFKQLSAYLSYERTSWTDGLIGDEWDTIEHAQMCGEEAADQVIEREEREENDD